MPTGGSTNLIAKRVSSTSILSGGALTVNAGDNTKFDIAAGDCQIVDNTDPMCPIFTEVSFGPFVAITATEIGTQDVTSIAIDVSGSVLQKQFPLTQKELRSIVHLGNLAHFDRLVIAFTTQASINGQSYNTSLFMSDISDALKSINSGNIYSPFSTDLRIQKSAGTFTRAGLNFFNDPLDPNLLQIAAESPDSFTYVWQDGSGGFNVAAATEINPGVYDDGTGGVLEPNGNLLNNKWTNVRVWRTTGGTFVQYGQVTYNSQAEALNGQSFEGFNILPTLDEVPFRAFITHRGGAADLSLTTDAIFVKMGKFGDVAAGGGGTSTTTIQQAYDNGAEPEILTNVARGALTIRRGTAADTDDIIEGQNNAGTCTFAVTGEGIISQEGVDVVRTSVAQTGGTANLFLGGTLNTGNTGSFNVFAGEIAGRDNTTGFSNFYLGQAAGISGTSASKNIAIGQSALGANLVGDSCVAIGQTALAATTSGGNIGIGQSSLKNNIVGGANSVIGVEAGLSILSSGHSLLGHSACRNNTAFQNSIVGQQGLMNNSGGGGNSALGAFAGKNSDGLFCLFLGHSAGLSKTGSNKFVLGNSSSSELMSGTFDTDTLQFNAALDIIGQNNDIQLLVKANSSQSANLVELQDSTGSTQFAIAGNGRDFILDTTTGTKIGTATTQKLGFYNATPITQPTEITDELTTITHTAPGTPDFAIQDLTDSGGFGFVTKDEGNTVLSVIENLQARVNELEDVLSSLGLVADAD